MNMTKETKVFGKALLEMVASSEYTLADAAVKVGVEMDTFANWCNGVALPSEDEFRSIINVLGIGVERVIYHKHYDEAIGSLVAQKALMNTQCYDLSLHEWESEDGSCGVYNGVFYAIDGGKISSDRVGIGDAVDEPTYFAILSIVHRWAVANADKVYKYLGSRKFCFYDTFTTFATAATIEDTHVGTFELDGETRDIHAPAYWFNKVMAEANRARFGAEDKEPSVAIEWLDDSKSTGVFKGMYFEVKYDSREMELEDCFELRHECNVVVTRLPDASDLVLFEHLLLTEKVANWSSNSNVEVVFITGLNRRPDEMGIEAMDNTDRTVDTSVVVRHPVFLGDFLMRASDALGYEVGYDVDEADS